MAETTHDVCDGVFSKITESNFPTKLLEYTATHHTDAFIHNMDACPHELKRHGADYSEAQFMVWLTHA